MNRDDLVVSPGVYPRNLKPAHCISSPRMWIDTGGAAAAGTRASRMGVLLVLLPAVASLTRR